MKHTSIISAILSFGLSAVPLAAQTPQIGDCFKPEFDRSKVVFDSEHFWMQRRERGMENFEMNASSVKALRSLNEHFAAHDVTFSIAIMPRPLFGRPPESAELSYEFEAQQLKVAYRNTISELEDIGISTPDLTRIYDYFDSASLQRNLDHHLTSKGAWAVGAMIAHDLKRANETVSELSETLGAIEELSSRKTQFTPSNSIRDALTVDCIEKIGRIYELDYYEEKTGVSDSALFGAADEQPAKIILTGTSYSEILDGAIGRSIEYFSDKPTANYAVNAGGSLSSLEYAIREHSEFMHIADVLIWEVVELKALNDSLAAMMILKSVDQPSCTPESALYQEGILALDDNGIGTLGILGILEDRLELDLPVELNRTVTLTYGVGGEKTKRIPIRRNFDFWKGETPSYLDKLSLWLPTYGWFPEDVSNAFSLQIEIDQETPLVEPIKYSFCAASL